MSAKLGQRYEWVASSRRDVLSTLFAIEPIQLRLLRSWAALPYQHGWQSDDNGLHSVGCHGLPWSAMICRGTSQFWIAVSESLLVTGCHPVDHQSCLPAFAKYRYIPVHIYPHLSASPTKIHQGQWCWSQLMVVWSRWWYKFHSSYIFWPTRRCRESYIRYILDIHNPSYSHFLHQLLDFHWLSTSTSCGCGVHILWQILWSGTVRSRLACFTSGFGSSFGSGSGCEFQPPMAQRTQRYPKVDLKRFTNRWCVCANGLLQTELN